MSEVAGDVAGVFGDQAKFSRAAGKNQAVRPLLCGEKRCELELSGWRGASRMCAEEQKREKKEYCSALCNGNYNTRNANRKSGDFTFIDGGISTSLACFSSAVNLIQSHRLRCKRLLFSMFDKHQHICQPGARSKRASHNFPFLPTYLMD